MYPILKTSAISLMAILFSCCMSPVQIPLTFSEREFDFGPRAVGDTVRHVFKIKNNGPQSLQILAIESSCSCTVGDWTRSAVLSGQEAAIDIRMIVRDTGYIRTSVIVQLNRDSIFYPLFLVANKK